MLERFFSTRRNYRKYALSVALILSAYLVGGFMLVKWAALGEVTIPSLGTGLLLVLGILAFAGTHIASMKQLDRTR